MKVYLNEKLAEKLPTQEPGTILLGTLDKKNGVATVVDIFDAENKAHHLPTIASIGPSSPEYPLYWSHQSGWHSPDGLEMEEIIYKTEDFQKRTPFDKTVMEHLSHEKILVVGIGSLGAPIGLELAKSGIGKLIAVDKDILEIHNCMRHTLGSSYIGWPKSVAFAEYLKTQAPDCTCVPVYDDLFSGDRKRLKSLLEKEKPTRILALTDSLRVQYLCQMLAIEYQLPYMAVWCDSNAVEGEIFFWEPGQASGWEEGRPQRGCYGCLRHPNEVSITKSAHFDYSQDDPDSYGGEPALGSFINRIANTASLWMTAWILSSCPVKTQLGNTMDKHYENIGLQYLRIGGPYSFNKPNQLTAKEPWAMDWYRVMKREDCPYCSDSSEVSEILFPCYEDNSDQNVNEWESIT